MAGWLGGLFNFLGSIATGIFGASTKKAEVIQSAYELAKDVNESDDNRDKAKAKILEAAMKSESWLTKSWRPITMLVLVFDFHLLLYWLINDKFPPQLLQTLPPLIDRLFDVIIFGLGGYMGLRSVEKIVHYINTSGILKKLLDRYI